MSEQSTASWRQKLARKENLKIVHAGLVAIGAYVALFLGGLKVREYLRVPEWNDADTAQHDSKVLIVTGRDQTEIFRIEFDAEILSTESGRLNGDDGPKSIVVGLGNGEVRVWDGVTYEDGRPRFDDWTPQIGPSPFPWAAPGPPILNRIVFLNGLDAPEKGELLLVFQDRRLYSTCVVFLRHEGTLPPAAVVWHPGHLAQPVPSPNQRRVAFSGRVNPFRYESNGRIILPFDVFVLDRRRILDAQRKHVSGSRHDSMTMFTGIRVPKDWQATPLEVSPPAPYDFCAVVTPKHVEINNLEFPQKSDRPETLRVTFSTGEFCDLSRNGTIIGRFPGEQVVDLRFIPHIQDEPDQYAREIASLSVSPSASERP